MVYEWSLNQLLETKKTQILYKEVKPVFKAN